MFLLKIGIFKINISSIFSLVLGIAMGLAIFTLIYLAYVLGNLNKNKRDVKIVEVDFEAINDGDLSKKEKKELLELYRLNNNSIIVKEMIMDYEKIFCDNKLRNNDSYTSYCMLISKSLIYNIAKVYYPNSSRPYAEIKIEEALKLSNYISKRVDELLDYNGLKFIRGISLKTIVNIKNFKDLCKEWKIVKLLKKYKINKLLAGLKVVINFVNPFYWVRKAIIDTSIRIITKQMCLRIIGIVGEEAYNVYSKSVFKEEISLNELEA